MITEAVSYSASSRILVDQTMSKNANTTEVTVWTDDTLKNIRAEIKKHYISEQDSTCCYCDQFYPTSSHRSWDVDHIIPWSSHPWFMLEPRNLAVACQECNNHKGDQRTTKRTRRTFPSKSDDYVIVHPHLDVYDEHIYRNGYVYQPKSEKGLKTITQCKLLRFAVRYIDWDSAEAPAEIVDAVSEIMEGKPRAEAKIEELIMLLRGP